VLAALRGRRGASFSVSQLARTLGADARAARGLRRMLRELEGRGLVERLEGRYRARREDGAVEGQLASLTAGGAGLVLEASGAAWRVADAGGAHVGDRVLVQPAGSGRADLLHVLEGGRDHWIGILHRRGGMAHATPYRDDGDWWLRVAATDAGDARDGEVVELVPAARRRRKSADAVPWARVTRRIGFPGEPDADFAAVVWRHRLPVEFPEAVEAEVRALPEATPAAEPGRLDLRARPFVTIDPEDARDYDDAVCAEPLPDGGMLLQVAVADVAHYVTAGSALDREALRRGNSVYFPDRAIPMLPPRLSSDLCSLRPELERPALVAELVCDASGATRRARFHEAWVRSHARLSYAQAQSQLEGAPGPHAEMLRRLARWAALCTRERRRRGGLDFELPGVEIGFDAQRRAAEVRRAPRCDAHRLIEEAMLAANRAVAEWLSRDGLPVPYRNHLAPGPEDAALLALHLRAFGLARDLPVSPLPSGELARALEQAPPEQAEVIHMLALRHLRQARYGAACAGHYALAMQHYLHFTSPIRRYPDLAVHRAVKLRLAGAPHPYGFGQAQSASARASFRERLAQRAEREMLDLARCAFLQGHVGEEHDGVISGLGRMGLFVSLATWPIDGLVPARRLPGATPDALGHALEVRGGRRYRLGDRVRVQIARVEVARARIDLELLAPPEDAEERAPRTGRAQGPSRRGGARRASGRASSRAAATL
jgi:ribonuclease R